MLSSYFGALGRGVDFTSETPPAGGTNIIMVPREYHEDAALALESILGDDLIFPEIRV